MTQLTFITPVAPYHTALLNRTIASVQAQTVPCDHIVIHDTEQHGPAWIRNEGLLQVSTPFVSFLDADDWIEPNFAEVMLAAWKPGRYCYSDWWQDAELKKAPARPWFRESFHVITTLLPIDWVHRVGGFDESLSAGEDTDFGMRLNCSGLCGIHVPQALFHYGAEGQRAKRFVQGPQYLPVSRAINKRYRGMSCCGGTQQANYLPSDEDFDGAILVQAIWSGNRIRRGLATGRLYPRAGNGKIMHVHFSDADASPDLWQRYMDVPPPAIVNANNHTNGGGETEYASVEDVAAKMFGEPEIEKVRPADVQPDVSRAFVLGLEGLR